MHIDVRLCFALLNGNVNGDVGYNVCSIRSQNRAHMHIHMRTLAQYYARAASRAMACNMLTMLQCISFSLDSFP